MTFQIICSYFKIISLQYILKIDIITKYSNYRKTLITYINNLKKKLICLYNGNT